MLLSLTRGVYTDGKERRPPPPPPLCGERNWNSGSFAEREREGERERERAQHDHLKAEREVHALQLDLKEMSLLWF